jgi:hypothetical protein
MGTQFERIGESHRAFIEEQHIFFCGTAADEGRVNISPKGMDSLRVMGPNRIVWRNWTGSGNETAAHLALHNRMTLMWCGFGKRPMIMRAYGTARTLHPRDADFAALGEMFPPSEGARQIYDMSVEMLQTSCGYAVPYFDHKGGRDTLRHWTEDKGPAGIAAYWEERNQRTIDGLPTHILEEGDA